MSIAGRATFVSLVLLLSGGLRAGEIVPAWPEVDAAPAAEEPVEHPEATGQRYLTDRMELETTLIRGNQELPRVLYIVPWKDPSLGSLAGKPVNSLIDEVLAPLDRDVFLRQTKYFDQLYGAPEREVRE